MYLPARGEDGGRGVAGLVQLDVGLGTRGRGQAQGREERRRYERRWKNPEQPGVAHCLCPASAVNVTCSW